MLNDVASLNICVGLAKFIFIFLGPEGYIYKFEYSATRYYILYLYNKKKRIGSLLIENNNNNNNNRIWKSTY